MTYDIQEETIKPNEYLVLDYFKRVKLGDLQQQHKENYDIELAKVPDPPRL